MNSRTILAAAVLVLALCSAFLWLDRQSLERANRLYRAGEIDQAAEIYARYAAAPSADPTAYYNAGTAHLRLGEEGAEAQLLVAAESDGAAAEARAEYNLGQHYLTSAGEGSEPDTAIALLRSSIARTRAALRLDPTSDNARWNLALAQVRLDSLTQVRLATEDRESPGEDETRVDLESLTRGVGDAQSGIEPEDARASEVLGRRLAAAQGAREAWASQDPGPLTEASARRLLETARSDPEQLIRGLVWAHRPDVAWWNAEPYPGGNW